VAALRPAGEHRDGGRDSLELKTEIRRDADDRDKRHQYRKRKGLSVPGGNEVGYGGDPVLFRNKDDLSQDNPPERCHERGPDIDRKKTESGIRCLAHAAVKSPGRAVYGKREGVNVGIRYQALPLQFLALSKIGHAEQEKKIGEYDRQYDPGRKHLAAVLSLGKDAGNENQDYENEPDDEQKEYQIFFKNAQNGPVEKENAQHEQKDQNVGSHRESASCRGKNR
jgi:hypothetical protein